jgi:hypothetical protein
MDNGSIIIALVPDMEILKQNIEIRLKKLGQGMVEETKHLHATA